MAKEENAAKKTRGNKGRKKGRYWTTEKQIVFFLVTLAAILISFFAFSYLLNKPCFEYKGFRVCKVALEGTSITFYSIPAKFTTSAGLKEERNVVLRNNPEDIEKLNIPVDVNDYFLKTRPQVLWITMDPKLESRAVAAGYEILKFANEDLDIRTALAFTEPAGNNSETNIVKCEESSNAQRVIWIKYIETDDEQNDVEIRGVSTSDSNPSCIVVESNSYDGMIETADALVIEWLLRIT